MALALTHSRGALALLAAALAGCDAGGPGLVPSVVGRRELVHAGAPHAAHVTDPALALAPDGAPHLAWIRRDGADASVRSAVIDGADRGDAAGVRVDPPERPVGGRPPAAGPRDRARTRACT